MYQVERYDGAVDVCYPGRLACEFEFVELPAVTRNALDSPRDLFLQLIEAAGHLPDLVAGVGRRQERGHRVGVGVVQLDAVEAGLLGAQGGCGKEFGQHLRQIANLRQVHIRHPFAVAITQRFPFARRQDVLELLVQAVAVGARDHVEIA